MITLGSVADKLRELGYVPTSATHVGKWGHTVSEDPAAIVCIPGAGTYCGVLNGYERSVVGLTIAVRDKVKRQDIQAVFAKHGLGGKGAPVRVGSDGAETHVVQMFYHGAPSSKKSSAHGDEIEAAVYLDSHEGEKSAIIPLAGTWRGGDLVTTPRNKLPELDSAKLAELLNDVDVMLRKDVVSTFKNAPLTPEMLARKKERERLEAEIAKRTDASVWKEVDQQASLIAHRGASAWELARNKARVETDEWKLGAYDAIVAEREEAAEKAARQAAMQKRQDDFNAELRARLG